MGKQRIGVFGGSFDPIHNGHLAAAKGACHLLDLDRMLLMPAANPPHKCNQPLAPADKRLAMVRLALAGAENLEVTTVDLERPGPHYTVDALTLLGDAHPDWELICVIGLDSLLQIESWYRYETLLTQWNVAAVTRPGSPAEVFDEMCRRLGPRLSARLCLLSIPGVAISAGQVRELIADGYPLDYLVPEPVRLYIAVQGLYS